MALGFRVPGSWPESVLRTPAAGVLTAVQCQQASHGSLPLGFGPRVRYLNCWRD